jgi:hypothetical protein
VKFADLLQFQKMPQTLEELHAKATAYAALNPRLRTEFLEECEIDAKECIRNKSKDANENLQYTYNIGADELSAKKTNACSDIFNMQVNCENTLQIKKSGGLSRQTFDKNNALSDFVNAATIPDRLAQIQSTNQFDSLKRALTPYPETALPFRFRILSRANESYGTNNWTTKLANTPENFYDLLMGTADDEYHSDFEPIQNTFLQGTAGNFVCNKMLAAPSGYNSATGTAPMAAVGAFSFVNITNQDVERSIKFGLSSYNFAAVFLKTDEWTPLFQATGTTTHSSVMSADFVVPAGQPATLLLVSTPYYYRYSYSGRDIPTTYQSHIVQFLQWDLFNMREMLGDILIWRPL